MGELIKTIQNIVQKKFSEDSSGHDWFHIERVYKMALHLHSIEGGNKEQIELGALLHDISDHKLNGGKLNEGGNVAYQLLIDNGCNAETALKVKSIVDSTSFKGAHVKDETTSLEAKIVQDADRLDAIGAIGIARTFAYGGHVGNPLYDPSIEPKLHDSFKEYATSKTHTINHFHEKLLLLADRMHTNEAKKIGRKRTLLMYDFLESFHKEWNTEIE